MASATKRGSNGRTADKQDAIALLKADHRKVEGLFDDYEKARSTSKKRELAQEICKELIVHSQIEEEIFYPAVRGQIEEDLVQEAYVEHDGAKVLITELLRGSSEDEFYDAKVMVLAEEIRHHVKEEEKRGEGMFSQAREAGLDMDALGEQMAARKEELLAEIEANGPPLPETRTFRTQVAQGELPA